MWTIVVGSIAGWLAIRGGSRSDGAGLGWAVVLLVLALVPAVFGWVALLYLPSLLLVIGAAVRFITRRP
ncbi:MAG: GlsB/YeaQ/YmgE family stress response membrane protein [Actinobacteria bacterium]|nr:GlsB/YeaQ/YmgE family stress response membrane protein [Actinomycetota bacterium]